MTAMSLLLRSAITRTSAGVIVPACTNRSRRSTIGTDAAVGGEDAIDGNCGTAGTETADSGIFGDWIGGGGGNVSIAFPDGKYGTEAIGDEACAAIDTGVGVARS